MRELLEQKFLELGFKIVFWNEKANANGPDLVVQKGKKRPLTVELKKVRASGNGSFVVDPVLKSREKDDLIAIVLNEKMVLIEPMQDHLKCCSPKGTRALTILY